MKPIPFKAAVGVLAGSLVLAAACGASGATIVHPDNTGMFPAARYRGGVAFDVGGWRAVGQGDVIERADLDLTSPSGSADGFSPFAYDPLALAGEGLDGQLPFSQHAVPPYPIENGGGAPTGLRSPTQLAQLAPSGRLGRSPGQLEAASAARKIPLPEPGNWAMVLAGLLGVCAIARRRMSQ